MKKDMIEIIGAINYVINIFLVAPTAEPEGPMSKALRSLAYEIDEQVGKREDYPVLQKLYNEFHSLLLELWVQEQEDKLRNRKEIKNKINQILEKVFKG